MYGIFIIQNTCGSDIYIIVHCQLYFSEYEVVHSLSTYSRLAVRIPATTDLNPKTGSDNSIAKRSTKDVIVTGPRRRPV